MERMKRSPISRILGVKILSVSFPFLPFAIRKRGKPRFAHLVNESHLLGRRIAVGMLSRPSFLHLRHTRHNRRFHGSTLTPNVRPAAIPNNRQDLIARIFIDCPLAPTAYESTTFLFYRMNGVKYAPTEHVVQLLTVSQAASSFGS